MLKTFIKLLTVGGILLLIQSCNGKSSNNNSGETSPVDSLAVADTTSAAPESQPQSQPQQLSPAEWLNQYNAAWAAIQNQVPQVPCNPYQDMNSFIAKCTERDQIVKKLFQQQYPELFAYENIPAYRAILAQQGQALLNRFLQQNEAENQQLQEDLDRQVQRNDRDLERYKEELELFSKNYKAPEYVP